MPKHWIKKAVSGGEGKMTAAAKKEGVSNAEYIDEHKGDAGKAGHRARLAETLKSMASKHKEGTKKVLHNLYGAKEKA